MNGRSIVIDEEEGVIELSYGNDMYETIYDTTPDFEEDDDDSFSSEVGTADREDATSFMRSADLRRSSRDPMSNHSSKH